ncbi:MAG: hypothetical protein K2H37_08560 [Lachnospiraceae bacterium]|nr:hypothetical protein [Lachnospiraceae bacterium]
MESISKNRSARELAFTGISALLAVVCAGRIFLLLHGQGSVYTMGIFPLALLFGLYCLWKKALFLSEVFFPLPVRVFLAAAFAALQVLGLVYSHSGISGTPEAVLWVICFTPLTFAGQNMLFFLARKAAAAAGAEEPQSGRKGSFLGAFALIFGGFCIPFATYYPAIMAYDVIPQLDQIRVSGLTTHHPLIHTLLLKGCLKAGELLTFLPNPDRAGLAAYSLIQMAVAAACFACVYCFLCRRGVWKWLCYAFVLCAAVFPTHGMLAVSITKDTIYAALTMVFTVFAYELATGEESPGTGWFVRYGILTALLLLFRNNSVYAWVLYVIAATFFILRGKPFFRKACVFHGAAFLLYLVLNTLMVQAVSATSDTYAREMLSVPAQQIARVVQYHEEELTQEDREAIAAVWGENLPEYVSAIADRSKKDIAGDKETLRIFAGEWISLGLRYPGEYLQAFLLKNKGMWDLTDVSYLNDVYSYAKGYLQITYPSDQQPYMEALAPGYVRHQKLQPLQSLYRYFAAGDELWRYCPPAALVMQPAFYCYLLLFYCLCCIGLKKKALLLPAVYLLALAGTLLLGPCVLTRYVYPLMLSVTVLALLLFGRGRQRK